MSKQVELKGNTLYVQTRFLRENPNITRVVVKYTGEKTKLFNDEWKNAPTLAIEDITESYICGYRVKDLIVLAEDIKNRGIFDIDLKAYNENYLAGYKKACDEIEAQLTQSIQGIVSGIKDKA